MISRGSGRREHEDPCRDLAFLEAAVVWETARTGSSCPSYRVRSWQQSSSYRVPHGNPIPSRIPHRVRVTIAAKLIADKVQKLRNDRERCLRERKRQLG